MQAARTEGTWTLRVTLIVLCNPAQRPRSSFCIGFEVTAPDLLLPPDARLYRLCPAAGVLLKPRTPPNFLDVHDL
jgi:hypothetical protein